MKNLYIFILIILSVLSFPNSGESVIWTVENVRLEPLTVYPGQNVNLSLSLKGSGLCVRNECFFEEGGECALLRIDWGEVGGSIIPIDRICCVKEPCIVFDGQCTENTSICSYNFGYVFYRASREHKIMVSASDPLDVFDPDRGIRLNPFSVGTVNVIAPLPISPLPPDQNRVNPLRATSINQLLEGIGGVIYWIGTGILALMILVGGLVILNAAGDPLKVQQGKKIVIYSLIGFSVMVASRGIVHLIIVIIGRR